jgi:hypothetical protein
MSKLDDRQDHYLVPDADISTADEVIAQAEIPSDRLVSINIEATSDASYAIDVAAPYDLNGATDPWILDEAVYDQADEDDPQDIRDVFRLGDRHLRVRVTDPAANGETADVTIQVA